MTSPSKRDPDAYADVLHHLAWLCYHDATEAEQYLPLVDTIGETAALFDGNKTATPEQYVQAACDLLHLAAADAPNTMVGNVLARRVERALRLLERP